MWEINIGGQALTFLYAAVLGIILCVFYDIIRALRKAGLNSNTSVFITDMLFWLVNTFITFMFLMATTNGQVRAYVLIAQLIGFIICRLTLSKLLFPLLRFIVCSIAGLMGKISYYLAVACCKTEQLLHSATAVFCKKLKIALKEVKKLLKSRRQMLYTKENNLDLEHSCDGEASKA